MRFVYVHARAFGPFTDRRLELAPGMNVISGANGAGKSSWHAALYAGLCGMRRGPGRTKEVEFMRRFQPWQSTQWEVATEITLDSGQRIELHHDLNGGVDCSALDIGLGRDISDQIIYEGSPDGAKLVGLDRSTFLSTACVRQAEILAVLEHAGDLQADLQRAAATAGTDSTAAVAIENIASYSREYIGRDQKNSVRPLHMAKERWEQAQKDLVLAEAAHAEYLAKQALCEDLRNKANDLEREFATAEALFVWNEAEAMQSQYNRAMELSDKLATQSAPEIHEDADLATEVASSLTAYATLSAAPSGEEDPAALEAELASLPGMPALETTPDAVLIKLHDQFLKAEAALSSLDSVRPTGEPGAGISVAPASNAMRRRLYGGGLAAAAIALGLFTLHQTVASVIALAMFLLIIIGITAERIFRPQASNSSGDEPLGRRRAELTENLKSRRNDMLEKLKSRGYQEFHDLESVFQQYCADCADRNKDAVLAARRGDLEKRLKAAVSLTNIREQHSLDRSRVEKRLRDAALRCGTDLPQISAIAQALRAWQESRRGTLERIQESIAEQEELAGLLDGNSLANLKDRLGRKQADALQLASTLGLEQTEQQNPVRVAPSDTDLRALRNKAFAARTAADTADGELQNARRSILSVADAEEELANASSEFERLERLRETLETTKAFLEAAQEAVHRDIAPILTSTLEKWLPRITGQLYARATVDPETLAVKVRPHNGQFRDAQQLSYGTGEQIYLLLRIAMADHLTKASNEKCPLLFDDITAHCDATRTEAILDLLHEISADRQVILFSQERDVMEWARKSLREGQDRLEFLDAETLAV